MTLIDIGIYDSSFSILSFRIGCSDASNVLLYVWSVKALLGVKT